MNRLLPRTLVGQMILILLAVLLVSQVLLVQWKKHRPHSYQMCGWV